MSVGMSLLAILEDGPTYGLQLKNEFEARTGGVWPLNVGQVYTTLRRLQRDGLVESEQSGDNDSQVIYRLTAGGGERLREWFGEASSDGPPSREELVLKLVMVARRDPERAADVIQAERRGAVQLLQQYTRLKRAAPGDGDMGWLFLLDSLIFGAEARVRWLDSCEARLRTAPSTATAPVPATPIESEEVRS
jgi:DNA-binding PadR family transcriptional regulator